MSNRAEQIERFRNMAKEDPENDLAHYRLGQYLLEDGQFEEAAQSFRRTLEIQPEFSTAFKFLGESLLKLDRRAEAVEVFTKGWAVADERGDRVPRDAMAKHLADLGAPVPKKVVAAPVDDGTPGTGFRCQRPGCMEGKRARQLDKPPVPDAIGLRIHQDVCAGCWTLWLKDLSVKVVNELRLDLSSEGGQHEYDKNMREFFGFEQEDAT
ncbi:MAG: Fe(2+)-trafficking protein [Gemmataceae bacterium]|nr:Fe(2+)-trafficking protein [Gemmataceae bacterium]